jgi:DinB superfamily
VTVEDLRYPIGRFEFAGDVEPGQLGRWIDEIGAAPGHLREAVGGLSAGQLDTQYRPGGWTVRQVVHHLPDSHLNAYMRYKLALTEDEPMIKSYDESRWAELADARTAAIEPSLSMLEGLHERWTTLLKSLSPADWRRRFRHPEREVLSLAHDAGLYAWHGRHHVAHITALRKRMGWV